MADDKHVTNPRPDESDDTQGQKYTGGDYDPSEIDTRSREYYAYSGADYVPEKERTANMIDDKNVLRTSGDVRERHRSDYGDPDEAAEPRPKEAILSDIDDRLDSDPGLDVHHLSVSVNGLGEVTLRGSVHSFADRLAVEHAIQTIPGVTTISNRLRIEYRRERV